jgi:hypothetical protein
VAPYTHSECFNTIQPTGHYTNSLSGANCSQGSCQTDTAGRCDPVPFKWKLGGGTGQFFTPKVGLPTEGDDCSANAITGDCTDHVNTENGVNQYCFKNDQYDHQKYFCTCQ